MKKRNLSITLGISIPVLTVGTIVSLPFILKKKEQVVDPTLEEVKLVNEINNNIKDTKFDTMSELVLYLSQCEKPVDLEALNASGNNQYVWDKEKNVVFIMDENGKAIVKPAGYTLNTKKSQIWKMVNLSSSNGKIESFAKHSEYGQYLRESSSLPKEITFSSNLDTGFNPNLKLTYEKPASKPDQTPMVATYRSDLEITGTLSDIDHYGHAKSITVTKLADDASYNEYGTVDGNITLKDGNFTAKPASDINTILIESNDVETVTVESTTVEGVEIPAIVGTIAKTTEVTKSPTITIEVKTEEYKPDQPQEPVTPEQMQWYAAGFGTVKSPYVISNSNQLLHCQEDVNVNGKADNHFILGDDIDMKDVPGFTGIGTIKIEGDTETQIPFTGTFDGQGYTISNLTIARGIEPTSSKKVYAGLFGWVKGEPISDCTQGTIWDKTEKKVNYDTCLTKYTTSISNVNITKINNTAYADASDDARYIAGIAGRVNDALIYNCHVTSGSIIGKKHLGGIAGTMSNSLFYGCSTGADLTIECTEYNAGGICGSASGDPISKASCDVFGYCTNNATVKANSTITEPTNGNLSGIVALAGSSPKDIGTVIDNCINNGDIISNSTNPAQAPYVPSPTGISSDAHGVYVCSNCINNGKIIVAENCKSKYASGIVSYSQALIYKCQNNAKVSGYSNYMAGILAYQSSTWFAIDEFYSIGNSGEIINSNTSGITGPIVASSGSSVEISDVTFENVDELNNAIASQGAVSIALKNVIVKNTTGTLNILPSILSVSSDRKICSNVAVAGTSVTIDLPNTDITVSGAHDTTYLYLHGDNSNLIVNEGATLLAASVGGANSTLTNNGTIQSFTMTNKCVDSINNEGGFIGNVGFDDTSWKGSTSIPDKHFTNKGTIHTQGRQCHTISTISDNVKITLENYGTIKSENSWYLFLFYTNKNCVIKSYAGSVAETTGTSPSLFATHNTIISYYQEAKGEKAEAKVIDHGTEHKWTDYTYMIEHHKIQD